MGHLLNGFGVYWGFVPLPDSMDVHELGTAWTVMFSNKTTRFNPDTFVSKCLKANRHGSLSESCGCFLAETWIPIHRLAEQV